MLAGFRLLPAIPVPPRLKSVELGKTPLIRSYTVMISEYVLYLGQFCDIRNCLGAKLESLVMIR